MIYILEDDQSIQEMIVYTLNNQGYRAYGFTRPSEFYRALETELPKIVILDVMLPEEDGFKVLENLRNKNKYKELPVIMLTAKDSEYDKVYGLDNGADDYLTKPFSLMELISRINAIWRRLPNDEVLEFQNIKILKKRHEVIKDGSNVDLTLKEYELLKLFFENKNQVLSRDQLLTSIWGYDFDGENRTVDVHVRSLRKKLGDHIIQTVHGVGYIVGDNNDQENI